ncbi:MAG: RiPP maturation radical SAM C-methyltransferase, partial [Thermoplasmatales archaeon]|nr:RiPP maturation radical SAM C-methyltransferase [Thermoplasmatales archaeon]
MSIDKKNVLLIAMPFAGTTIPTVPLSIFEGYLKERNINIRTRHLYLKATEFYGLNNYNFLIYGPNETYPAQMAFSKYVFPEHWKKNKDKFRKYFNKKISKNRDIQKNFTFESYVQQTDKFCNWLIENVDWKNYDIIGFSIDYGQLLPSLAVAKKIKGLDSEKKIIFHGSRTVDQLGIKVLEAFDYVDFIVSGDAEDALFLLASDYQNYESIPHLIYRAGKEIIWNKSDDVVDLNSLPIPSFDSFYEELGSAFNEVKQYFYLYGRLPVEISRGCWWNKCTFCNLNLLHKKYTEKNIDKIIKEIKFLFNKYEMLSFSLVGNVLPKKNFRNLLEEIKKLKTDFSFMVETRTDHLKSNDYKLLKEAGFSNLLTGIESFSKNYLKKMNKGIRVIDNIAALKFCKENDIDNRYNIVINYPNEKRIDYEETMKNIQIIKQYLDPPNISRLIVGFGSPVYYNLEQFNIDKLDSVDIDRLMFPERFLKKGFNCIYGFKRKEKLVENDWVNLIEDWRKEREDLVIEAMRRKTTIDKLIFYFVDGKKFLKIYDKRNIK